ncbi:hypothetical protein EYF80_055178 [Liparis tanakae]|uniref:Uncharacterized protein n=1 Tax=Liparis tanakae TaxID=230148 RepID=A0A4Z2F0V2_9TELE|nr:hypothetical protein EYF80_055178 [Liparis tanakae]
MGSGILGVLGGLGGLGVLGDAVLLPPVGLLLPCQTNGVEMNPREVLELLWPLGLGRGAAGRGREGSAGPRSPGVESRGPGPRVGGAAPPATREAFPRGGGASPAAAAALGAVEDPTARRRLDRVAGPAGRGGVTPAAAEALAGAGVRKQLSPVSVRADPLGTLQWPLSQSMTLPTAPQPRAASCGAVMA